LLSNQHIRATFQGGFLVYIIFMSPFCPSSLSMTKTEGVSCSSFAPFQATKILL